MTPVTVYEVEYYTSDTAQLGDYITERRATKR